jgi:hypothetical protein
MAGVTLDGPVGLRWRTQNVKNYSRDQTKIIDLLKQIPASDGGKKEEWATAPLAGADGKCPKLLADAIWDFQKHWKSKGQFRSIDGVVDPAMNTLAKLNALTPGGGGVVIPTETKTFVCGPDVTEQVARIWMKIQTDFRALTFTQKIAACNTILLPFKFSADGTGIPTNLEELKNKVRSFADIDGWDTLPLFQGTSDWLRTLPVHDAARNGPCATPGSTGDLSDPWDPRHESDEGCSNTVAVGGKCWLNGSVNYGTFGIMVRLCRDFGSTFPLSQSGVIQAVYSITWAETLIKAYKKFGSNPEGAVVPLAWTRATFDGGPRGVPTIPGNRPKCKCTCGCSGDVAKWDYIWKPHKAMGRQTR